MEQPVARSSTESPRIVSRVVHPSGQQCFEQYPPLQAAILTSWRLLRCSPLHLPGYGFGVDEPQWPPVKYWAGSGRVRTFIDDEISRQKATTGSDDNTDLGDDPLGIRGIDADEWLGR